MVYLVSLKYLPDVPCTRSQEFLTPDKDSSGKLLYKNPLSLVWLQSGFATRLPYLKAVAKTTGQVHYGEKPQLYCALVAVCTLDLYTSKNQNYRPPSQAA